MSGEEFAPGCHGVLTVVPTRETVVMAAEDFRERINRRVRRSRTPFARIDFGLAGHFRLKGPCKNKFRLFRWFFCPGASLRLSHSPIRRGCSFVAPRARPKSLR